MAPGTELLCRAAISANGVRRAQVQQPLPGSQSRRQVAPNVACRRPPFLGVRVSVQGWLLSLSFGGGVQRRRRNRTFTGQDLKRLLDQLDRSFGRGDRCKAREWPFTLRTNWCFRSVAVLQGPKAKGSLSGSECRVSWFTYSGLKIGPWRPTF